MALIKKNSKCRACSGQLEEFLSLGKTALANSFLKKKDFDSENKFPLRVGVCRSCKLVQLMDVVDKKHLFSSYVYFFSAMPAASKHFGDYADDVIRRFIKNPENDLVVEIGSNDGLLLKLFESKGCRNVLGVDPAKNIAKVAKENGVSTITDFFSEKLAKDIFRKEGRAKAIIGNNVIAHIDNWDDLAKGINKLLDDKGVFIFEAPYLMDMFKNLAYDTIYHEHLSYLAVAPLVKFFKQYKMDVFDIQATKRFGTSIRVFVGHAGSHKVKASVNKFLAEEKKAGFDKLKTYCKLAERIKTSKENLVAVLTGLKNKNFRVAAYGAPARGNTILNFCNIGPDFLDFATEELKSKIGFYTPGNHIPVKHIEEARKNPPDYYLMLTWNYKDQIFEKEADFIKRGGKFIIPIGDKIEII